MEKEFVEYSEAVALKELGLSLYPIGGYQGDKVFYYEKGELYYDSKPMYSSDSHSGQILAPLYQQAFRWFRSEYSMDSFIKPNIVIDVPKTYQFEIDGYSGDEWYNTYEEAELACLVKLIDIVKGNNILFLNSKR
jgi:hypothetical protein